MSQKDDIDEEFGKIGMDYEGTNQDGEIIVLSKRNSDLRKKELPRWSNFGRLLVVNHLPHYFSLFYE